MKIAVLYIALNGYDVFFPGFYNSAEQFFLPEDEKTYFVWTDVEGKEMFRRSNIVAIHQEDMGWPDNTLKRFHLFDSASERLAEFDHIFFFNANMVFMMPVTREEFLNPGGLVAVKHPGFYRLNRSKFTYDENPDSLACVRPDEGEVYVCGGVNGGASACYLAAIRELKRRIDADAEKGVIALWHDESQWNRYIIGRDDVRVLEPDYVYPDLYELPGCVQKIRLLWKQKYINARTKKNQRTPLGELREDLKNHLALRSCEKKRERERKEYLAAQNK